MPGVLVFDRLANGNMAPNEFSGYRISGLALVPAHKEVLFSVAGWGKGDYPPSGIMNAVLTFSWPEIYQ